MRPLALLHRDATRPWRGPAVAVLWSCLIAAMLMAPGAGGAEATASLAGRSLDDALLELRARGLKILYTSKVVRPDMTVAAEPSAEHLANPL